MMKRFVSSITYTIVESRSQSEASLIAFWNSKSYCFLHPQKWAIYIGLQSQRHTYFICTFLVKDACTCIFCFQQILWYMVVSYRYADCFSALDYDARKSCYSSVKTLIWKSVQVDNNSLKSVQLVGNALWFTAASSVDGLSFNDEAFTVRLLFLLL